MAAHLAPARAATYIAPPPAAAASAGEGGLGEDVRLRELFGSHCYSEGPLFPTGGGGRKYGSAAPVQSLLFDECSCCSSYSHLKIVTDLLGAIFGAGTMV